MQRPRGQALESPDEIRARTLHSAENRAETHAAQSRDGARVEAIGVRHALEPVDAIGTAARD